MSKIKTVTTNKTVNNHRKNKLKLAPADKFFNVLNAIFMTLLVVLIVVPLLHLIANAFSDGAAKHAVVFLPKVLDESGNVKTGLTLRYFQYIIFEYDGGVFINSLKNTAIITIVVTLGSNLLMAFAAYPLSKSDCPFKKPLMIFFLITMLFSAGVLPIYLLMSSMHLTENIFGIILISLSNVFNLLLFKTTFEGIPKELEESALIDGSPLPSACASVHSSPVSPMAVRGRSSASRKAAIQHPSISHSYGTLPGFPPRCFLFIPSLRHQYGLYGGKTYTLMPVNRQFKLFRLYCPGKGV